MTPERWQEIKQLFNAALEYEPAGRLAFVAQASGNDESLRQEVTSLLESLEQAADFIETPASDLAAELLARGQTGLVAGQMVGPFRISDVLAAGGMGEVYLADDTRLGRKVALKLLPPHFTMNADRVRRFELEARAASALNHPNIVTIHEIGETDDLHFIATEFVAGQTLREHMGKTRMTVGEVLDIGVQIASALQAAHDAGIVHRDIKPENIMLRHDGFVKVLDFGLAKLAAPLNSIGETPETLLLTNPGVVMGTVAYMSPEQARALEVDARADIWSLGVVLYEMVAGRAPFEEPTSSDVIAAILKDEPESLATRADVPAELAQIIAKALRKDRTLRYQSAGELASDLKNLKEELGVAERLNRRFHPGKRSALSGKAGAEHDESGHQAVTTGPIPQPLATVSVEYLVGNIQRHKIFISVALLVLLGIGLTYIRFSRNKANSPTSVRSIAVLPLKPIDPANRDDIYEIGITDSLIRQLGSMKGISVRPLSATRQYRDIAQDPIAAGKEQQVDYVLATNYQLTGGRISITAQLLNVASGQIEESYKTEKDVANNFAMQDAVAVEIGNWLLVQFATTTNHLARKRGTSNEEAYRLFLQGMYLANNRNLEDARRAIEALEKAVQLDPKYARAWAGLGYAHRTVSLWTGSESTSETYKKSIAAINRALALDENLSEGHSALCENKYLYEWDFAGAERECRRAIELDPASSQAHEIFSRYLMGRGRHDEAIAEIKLAIDLEPTSRFNQRNYGRALFYARRYPEAEEQFRRVVTMDQYFAGTYSWLTSTLVLQGKEAEAFDWFQKLLAVRRADEETIQVFRVAFQSSGWHGIWREWLKRFDRIGGTDFDGAAYNAQIGNKDLAFAYLQKICDQREIWATYLRVDPRLDPLRDDPRFQQILNRVESK